MANPVDIITKMIEKCYFSESVYLVNVMFNKSHLWQPAASGTLRFQSFNNSQIIDIYRFCSGFPYLCSIQLILHQQPLDSNNNGLLNPADPTDLIKKDPNMGVLGKFKLGKLSTYFLLSFPLLMLFILVLKATLSDCTSLSHLLSINKELLSTTRRNIFFINPYSSDNYLEQLTPLHLLINIKKEQFDKVTVKYLLVKMVINVASIKKAVTVASKLLLGPGVVTSLTAAAILTIKIQLSSPSVL